MEKEVLKQAAEKFGTPIYVYSLPKILSQIELVKSTLEGVNYSLAFAMKANFNQDLLKLFHSLGLMIDCVSIGEYLRARKVGFSPSKIIVNGNCKKREELKLYVDEGIFSINLDSYEELIRLEALANKPVNVCIRVNPDVDAKTDPHIATGLKEHQFGVDYDTAARMIERISKNGNIKLIGLHCHIGSQIVEVEPYEEALNSLKDFVRQMNLNIQVLNIGGGWGIDYGDGKSLNLKDYKKRIVPLLKDFNVKIVLELGRFIVGPAGYLVARVEYVKKTNSKIFVIVDTGMTHLIRPALYGAKHRIIPLYDTLDREETVADVVGPACESSDVIRKTITLPLPREGDLIAIGETGAYGYAMASDYNLIPKPLEIIWDGKMLFRSS
ncbi:diaminopimelate decarboxylase [Pseudothermotoga thermarum]|uniref:diaminopimelate decarboxylase n=1 Tax=Pseudothermotoga thermarum TaxID=119394 RepID=UPI0002D5CDC8|nr:diaminopimelate decarboxylase [Pseudothermotoga thermarum]